ncbi:MAG: restriction endonuclease, partial [Minicystis sp.]
MTNVQVELREWQTVGPEQPGFGVLRGLRLDSSEARALARRLTEARVIEVVELYDGIRIGAFAHVGRVQLGSLTITIEPKLGTAELLELLRYAYGLRDLRLFEPARFATTGRLLQDLIVMQLLAEVRELVGRGLYRAYVPRAELLGSPRGRIDMTAVS